MSGGLMSCELMTGGLKSYDRNTISIDNCCVLFLATLDKALDCVLKVKCFSMMYM